MNDCDYTDILWEWTEMVFRSSNRDKDSILNTLDNWRNSFSSHPMVERVWNIFPGTICWEVWKKLKAQIFVEEKIPEENMLVLIK